MSEEIVNTPPVETPLPSDTPAPVDYSAFELSDDIKTGMKDGKIQGQFGSVQEVLDKLKESENRYAEAMRTTSDADKAAIKTAEDAKLSADSKTAQDTAIVDMIPDFVANGMQLTPEMEAKATAVGLDIRDLKLGAIDLRDKTNAAYDVVGGKESYVAMQDWATQNLTEAEAKAFTIDVNNPNVSTLAIEGLKARFDKAEAGEVPYERINGTSYNTGLKPYASRAELMKDKVAVESVRNFRNTENFKRYQARLNITPDTVWL